MAKIGWIVVGCAAIFLLVVFSGVMRGCDTASKMADQTVFNADKHVWSYEEFRRQFAQYEQYKGQLADVESRLAALEKSGVRSGQRYDNLVMETDGVRQMMRRIAANYNAMSRVAYQKIWKGDLPEKLGE